MDKHNGMYVEMDGLIRRRDELEHKKRPLTLEECKERDQLCARLQELKHADDKAAEHGQPQ